MKLVSVTPVFILLMTAFAIAQKGKISINVPLGYTFKERGEI